MIPGPEQAHTWFHSETAMIPGLDQVHTEASFTFKLHCVPST